MTPPWKWPKNCNRSGRRGSDSSARPGSTETTRKPAAPVKPFAVVVSARLGGLSLVLLKISFASRWNAHRQGFVAFHKTRIHPLRFADNFDALEAFQHFLPHDPQLQ